jgi:hypothetical protein
MHQKKSIKRYIYDSCLRSKTVDYSAEMLKLDCVCS